MKAQELSGKGRPSLISQTTSARDSGSRSRLIHPANGSPPQPTLTITDSLLFCASHAFALANRLCLARLAANALVRRVAPFRTRYGLRSFGSKCTTLGWAWLGRFWNLLLNAEL